MMMKKWMVPSLFFLAAIGIGLWNYPALPEMMAVHFGPSNEADNWVSKPVGVLMLPLMIPILNAVIHFTSKLERDPNKRQRMDAVNMTVYSVVSALLFAVQLFIISYNLGHQVSPSFVAVLAAGILFVVIGNLMPRMPQNGKNYPKMSEAAYRKATRVGGRMMVGAGIIFTLASPLPGPILMPLFFGLLALFVIALLGSMLYYRREGAN